MSSLLAPLRTVHNTLLALVGWAEAGQSQQRSMEVTLLLQLARKTKGPMMRGAEYSGSILVTPSVEFIHCQGLQELYVHVAIKILKNPVYPWTPRDLPRDSRILKRLNIYLVRLSILYLIQGVFCYWSALKMTKYEENFKYLNWSANCSSRKVLSVNPQ